MLELPSPTYTLSREASLIERSVMRELLAQALDPAIISFATGLPATECLPTAHLQDCINSVLQNDAGPALQYGPPPPALLEWVADAMRQRGVPCQPENILMTSGNQQGLALLSRLFLDPGDVAVTEAFTFTGIRQVTEKRGAIVRPIPTDLETGADMDALEAAFAAEPRPRLAILIPDFHNPLGVSISAEKRQQAAQLAARYGVPLVEDDPYGLLRFEGEMLPPIKAYDEAGWVFYLGSFSKMLAPALRLGWMVALAELIPRLRAMRESLDLESSAMMLRAVTEFLQRGLLEPHLAQLRQTNRERAALMQDALGAHFSNIATWTQPQGGLFTWLTLPRHINSFDLIQDAIAAKVLYIPGGAFSVGRPQHNTMRLNFSNVPPQKIRQGIARLAQVVEAAL